MSKSVCLTGGGTAGHVMPNLALYDALREQGYDVFYIGSKGLEKDLVASKNIPFVQIFSGKLRRYFSWQNFLDVFKVGIGCLQCLIILMIRRPALVFSKGGFVAVPVVFAAWVLRIPVLSHESDVTPGLANRIISKFAKKLLYSFPESKKFLEPSALCVGSPVRPELLTGSAQRGRELCGFTSDHEIILFMGGSQGSVKINEAILDALPSLVEKYCVIHITGKGKQIPFADSNYKSFEFIGEELRHIYAATDFVVARAGANSIFEFLALNKPMLLIPLVQGSRGDQVHNARSFESKSWAMVLDEDALNANTLRQSIEKLSDNNSKIKQSQQQFKADDSVSLIIKAMEAVL